MMMASFKELWIIITLIVIHELGHVLLATIEKVKVEKIIFYPLGGITKFKMKLNISPIKELKILCAGPLFQCIAYLLLLKIIPNMKEQIMNYHKNILIFNLLPMYPLDGGRIMKIILDEFIPFQRSMKWTIRISYIVLLIFFFYTNTQKLNTVVMLVFMIILIKKEDSKKKIFYEKFLLERYLDELSFKKSTIITNINDFYRNRRHLIKEGNHYYLEKEYLEKKYQK